MKRNKILAMILTHGRPDRVITYQSLIRAGFTGDICIVIDNEDKTRAEYIQKFGDKVYTFDKANEARQTDVCDNFPHRKAIVYARNAAFRIARELGYRFFIQLDDDYTGFYYKTTDGDHYIGHGTIKSIDAIFDAMLKLQLKSGADSVAMAQGGDFIGGAEGCYVKESLRIKRKCMNTWICDTERPLTFKGHLNEDASQYIVEGLRGKLFLTLYHLCIEQITTQKAAGGMTEIYNSSGTYLKSFYSIMQAPSCVKLRMIGHIHPRIHHEVQWNNACPKIIREEWRKTPKAKRKR